MPLPSKRKNEKENEFMSRCMSDDVMKKEFRTNKQRVAVCMNQYQTRKKIKGEAKMSYLEQQMNIKDKI